MIGQKTIQSELNKITSLDTLPKSIIACGKKGCGKHLLTEMIVAKYNLEVENLDYELSLEVLNHMYTLTRPKLFIIDNDALKEFKRILRFQNTLLKFIEEPPKFAWIIILTEDIQDLIVTIRNRCQIFKFKPYTLEELKEAQQLFDKHFTDEQLELLQTPGVIKSTLENDAEELWRLTDMVIDSLPKATPANALSLTKKFFTDEPKDLDLFLVFMKANLTQRYSSNQVPSYYWAYLETKKLSESYKNIMNLNKKDMFENYVLKLKRVLS